MKLFKNDLRLQYKMQPNAFSHFFRTNKKTEFLVWEWFICFQNLASGTKYNKKWYPSMKLMFHALCFLQIFLPILLFRPKYGSFVSNFLQLLMASIDRCSHKIPQRNSPSIAFPNKICLTHYDRRSKAFRLQIWYFGSFWPLFLFVNFDLSFVWFLIGYEGRYQSKTTQEHLSMIGQNAKKMFWRNCRYGILYCWRRNVTWHHFSLHVFWRSSSYHKVVV